MSFNIVWLVSPKESVGKYAVIKNIDMHVSTVRRAAWFAN